MASLSQQFDTALKQLKSKSPSPLFFPIGGEEKIYLADHRKPNGADVENAVERALRLYDALPAPPVILKIQGDPDSPLFASLKRLGLSSPDEMTEDALFWKLPAKPPFLRTLFREIIKSEISPEGLEELSGAVFFLNPALPFLFQLPDDRFAQVLIRKVPPALAHLQQRI